MHKNHFSSIWITNGISFNKTTEELKTNFKVFDNVISDEHVKCFNKYEYKPEKVQSQISNMFVYDLETINTERAGPHTLKGLNILTK